MIDADNAECVGVVAYARDWKPGDVIPQGAASDLRVLNVLEAEREDRRRCSSWSSRTLLGI
jgi:hypothetical protein